MEPAKVKRDQIKRSDPLSVPREVTEWDQAAYERIVSVKLTPEQRKRIVNPPITFPRQKAVLGIHWHPEFVPLELIRERVANTYPNREHELIIPTQHNELVEYDGYTGVEVDCYSQGFNRKVQLLLHFASERLGQADVLKAMLAHTFRYRASQLYEFIDSVIDPSYQQRVEKAAAKTGASEELVEFVRIGVGKLHELIQRNEASTPLDMLKNKILRNYFNTLREHYDDRLIDHAQFFLQAVKKIVKREFRLDYFYQTEEIIEEVRSLGGGIVVPHPEQFWPILLADYDVDGIEVWNPQSREYTEFLINVVHSQNQAPRNGRRLLLVTMGDDTHFGEKVIHPEHQDPDKANREMGYQPAWDEVSIRKSLIVANMNRPRLIEEYKSRLA